MKECWKFEAERRPSWEDLKEALADKKEYYDANAYEQIPFDESYNYVRYGRTRVE